MWGGELGRGAVWLVMMGIWAAPAAAQTDNDECLECHAVGSDVMEDMEDRYRVDPAEWMASIHADMDFACVDCHEDITDYPHDEAAPAECASCHDDAAEAFSLSIHANLPVGTNGDSPWPEINPCSACHGTHGIRAMDDPEGHAYPDNIPSTCGSCHGDSDMMVRMGGHAGAVDSYMASMHGAALSDNGSNGHDGGPGPAICTDCHGAHDVRVAADPQSRINPFNLPSTCAQCHEQEAEEYESSIHGRAFRSGISLAPTCNACHGIHKHPTPIDPSLATSERSRARITCPACHANEALMGGIGVAETRVRTYEASYHGLALKRGSKLVADCASCHGIHAIYEAADPRSMVAPENLAETCGECHPGANESFVRTPVHFGRTDDSKDAVIAGWVEKVYWVLLFSVLGGMVLHNLIIMFWYFRRKIHEERKELLRRRFSGSQVMQHAMLVTSFAVLVLTGFMLAYPDTWWAKLFVEWGLTEAVRRNIHRGGAVVMVIASVFHLVWMFVSPYGRQEMRRIAPGVRDVYEVLQNMKFHLGTTDKPATFAKYDYPAKAEYWAVVWGTVVMALTGLILWYPVIATSFMPSWVLKVSQVVHLFEAWLATLAILIFHFFYVMGHPEIYPISLAMVSGKMPEGQAKHHHPDWSSDQDAPRRRTFWGGGLKNPVDPELAKKVALKAAGKGKGKSGKGDSRS